jgi:hypothetical protein
MAPERKLIDDIKEKVHARIKALVVQTIKRSTAKTIPAP